MSADARSGAVAVERVDGVSVLWLNRPERLNALDLNMATALSAALSQAANTRDVTAVVITGRGKAFCGGGDLGWVMQHGDGPSAAIRELGGAFHRGVSGHLRHGEVRHRRSERGRDWRRILACVGVRLPRPAPDRHAATRVHLCRSHDGRGSSLMLPRLVGHARALEIAAFDAPIDAERAAVLGLATAIADADVVEGAVAMARRLNERSLHAFGTSKHLLANSYRSALDEQLAREAAAIGEALTTPEGREGVAAFTEKRRPDFARVRAISDSRIEESE